MSKPFQFRLRSIFWLTTAVAIACTCLIPHEVVAWEVSVATRLLAGSCVLSLPILLAFGIRAWIDIESRNRR